MAKLGIAKISLRYLLIFSGMLSISFSQNPVVQDGFAFIFPEIGYEGTPLAFEVKPPDSEQYFYLWYLGHSYQIEFFNIKLKEDRSLGPKVEFTYPGQGRNNGFEVKVEIYKDKISRTPIQVFKKFIPVYNVPPEVSLEEAPVEGFEGEELFFKASHIDPGVADKHVYFWNFDGKKTIGPNNSYQNTSNTTHTYTDDGLYTIYAIAQDDDNDADTVYHQITVKNIAPELELLSHNEKGKEGERISFKASYFDPGANDLHTFMWDFGDGELDTALNNLIDHVYLDDGEFNIQLIIKDNANDADTIQSTIFIENISPKIKVTIPPNGDEGTPISFSLSINDVGKNDTHTISWDMGDGNTNSSPTFTHSYIDNGEYTINVNVEDDDGGKDSWIQKIKIFNVAPTLEFSIPDSLFEGQTKLFNVIAQDKGINDKLTYLWNFGDGSTDSTKESNHSFPDNGDFKIFITVKDNDGGITTSDKMIKIKNVAPTLEATIPKKQYEGKKIEIVAKLIEDPGIDDEHIFQFNYGDGTISEDPNHIYRDNGDYNVEIILSDDDGGADTLNQLISIINLPPKIFGKLTDVADEGENVDFQISIEDPGNDDTHTYHWDFDDGEIDSVINTQHIFTDNGNYNIMIKVIDDDGGIDSLSHEITINNLPPTISASFTSSSKVQIPEEQDGDEKMSDITQHIDITEAASPKDSPTGDKDATVKFHCSVVDSGKIDTHSFLWNFGDGTTSTEPNIDHTYTQNGVFAVSIIAVDNDRGSDTLTQTITITNITPAMATTLISPDTLYQTIVIIPLGKNGAQELNTYSWDFGDGDTSAYYMPTHIYNENGEFLITSRINDKDSYTAINIQTIKLNGKSPILLPTDKKDLIIDDKSDDFFSKDIFTISSPRKRIYNPNSFPTVVFNIVNHSDSEKDVNLNMLIPDDWEIINLVKPTSLRPNIPERIRATLKIPYHENADEIHKIKLIAKIGNYDHMVSFMSTINVKIKEKPAFQIEAYRKIDEYEISENKEIEYIIRNTGNVTDIYNIEGDVPFDWEIISDPELIELKPDESKKLTLEIKTPNKKTKSLEKEVAIIGFSNKLKSKTGMWYDAIEGKDGICSDSFSEYCSINSRKSEDDCETEGIWNPEIKPLFEHCSDSLFTKKEDCERILEWIEGTTGTPSTCTNTTYSTLSECTSNGETWIAGTPNTDGYCSEPEIKRRERCEQTNTWFPTIRGAEAFCKSFPDRKSEDTCLALGEWFDSFQGTLSEDACIAERKWHPEKISNKEYCSESYWGNKEDCEYVSEWILSQDAIPSYCIDGNYNTQSEFTTKEECAGENVWFEETPAVNSHCLDGISKNLVECNSPGEWFPEVIASNAFCSDPTFTNQEECETTQTWTPEIASRDAFCSDQVSLLKEDCENPPGSEKSTLVTLMPRIKNSGGKPKSLYAKLPMILGLEIGNLSSDFYPRSRLSIQSPITKIGPYKTWVKYSQSYEQYEISQTEESSTQRDEYLNNYIIDKLQFYLSKDKWEILLGDSFVDKYELITRLSPIPIFGLNGSETFRGAQLGYEFDYLKMLFSHGTGPSFKKNYTLTSLSLSSKLSEEDKSYYSFFYQNTIDSISSINFISTQRLNKAKNISNGQILSLSNNELYSDGAAQLFLEYKNNIFKINNRSYYFGDDFYGGTRGRIGSDFTTYFNITKSIYNFSRIQFYNQNLFDAFPIYLSDEFNECVENLTCESEEESFTDLNDNGIIDIDTTYIEKVFTYKLDNKLFFDFNNGLKINMGLTFENSSFSNGSKGVYKVYETKISKSFKNHLPYFSIKHSSFSETNNDEALETKVSLGNRSIWDSINLNLNQDIIYPTEFEPVEYLTNVNGRFKFLKLNWDFILQINNLCPICTGEREKTIVETMGIKNNFSIKFLGIENRIRLGLSYAPKLNSFSFSFGIIPSGGSRSSKLQFPIPLVNVKGRYSGEIFIDENNNEIRDVNEKGVNDLMLFINGYISVTDEDGYFEFGALEPGQYQLDYDENTLDAKYKFREDFPSRIIINTGEKLFDSFPISTVCKISGELFIDSDLDKIKDFDEKIIENGKIIVQTTDNKEFAIYTDAKGRYEIPDLKIGTYNLIVDSEWLPERTVVTHSEESKKIFTKLGWPVSVSTEKSNVEFNIPINEKELEIRIDVKNNSNRNR